MEVGILSKNLKKCVSKLMLSRGSDKIVARYCFMVFTNDLVILGHGRLLVVSIWQLSCEQLILVCYAGHRIDP